MPTPHFGHTANADALLKLVPTSQRAHLIPLLRHHEIAPPAVDTDLGGPGLHTFGVNVDEFADAIEARLRQGELEMGYGTAELVRRASHDALSGAFQRLNARR